MTDQEHPAVEAVKAILRSHNFVCGESPAQSRIQEARDLAYKRGLEDALHAVRGAVE